jgi:hypothetical protein
MTVFCNSGLQNIHFNKTFILIKHRRLKFLFFFLRHYYITMIKTSDIALISIAAVGLLVVFSKETLFPSEPQNQTLKFLYDNNKIVGGALILAAGYFLMSDTSGGGKNIQVGGKASMSSDLTDLTSKDLTLDLSSFSSSIGSELGSSVSEGVSPPLTPKTSPK